NTGYSGYNLVGNPYASSIDWNTLSATNASAGIYGPGVGTSTYIYNEVAKVYAIYNASVGSNGATNIIPTGQGFFVKATAAGAQLIFNEAAKTNAQLTGPTSSTGSTLLLSASPVTDNSVQYLRLNLAADTINKEETIIRFENGASDSYVENEDSSYLQSLGQVSLSSMSADNIQSGINTIPFPKKSKTIKLKANTTGSGLFSLNLTEIKNVPELFEVWLMDAYKKDSLDMRHNSTYKFNVSLSDTNSFGLNRFSLVIRQNKALGVHLLNFMALKAARGAQIAWKVENEHNYTTFTVERSVDNGITFNQLGTLTSGGTGDYSFMDTNPLLVADKYRLKLIDLNGTVTYSNVVTLMYGNVGKEAASNISVYPNPAKGALNLTIVPASNLSSNSDLSLSSVTPLSATVSANTVYNIKIINNTGSVIKTATTSQAGWQTDVGSLLPGTYFIQVTNSNNKTLVGKSTFIKL
ncbi:MAG: trimeric autotransporter adhesin, partial [Mucilaginibacter sp.]|nr:trimeric autotransporter adhesin [Mucilaginibacter sp.]